MSWTYSGNPGADPKDHVRFLIGDTDPSDPLMTDEEIQFLLAKAGKPPATAIECCRILYAKFARQVNYSIGPESVQAGERAKRYKDLLDLLSKEYGAVHAPSMAMPQHEVFDIGMQDNKHAGRRGLLG